MGSQKPQRPDVDFGFHAQIPRLVRTGYKDLTPVQKWLYTCLKDLCGDHGTCYRTVKVLAEETGISTGMISESIPILHAHGLIHGEKKKRSTGGKEVWHITIVDIWQANAKAHPTKRSQNEQTLAANVHTVNENVHSVNDLPLKRSAGEYERSLRETEGLPRRITSNEALPVEGESDFTFVQSRRARIAMSLEEEISLAETIGHDLSRDHHVTNCRNWRGAHGGLEVASCEDYQAWIDSGGRDVPTDKFPAIASMSGEAASPPVALSRQSLQSGPTPETASQATSGQKTPVLVLHSQTSSSLSEPDGAVKSGGTVTRPRASDEQPTPVSLTAASATSPPATQMAAGAVTQASILADWEAIQGQPQAWTDRHYKAARQGVRASPTREELAGCRAWLPTTDNPKTLWYHSHGVELWDVIEKLNAYRSHLALSIEPAPLADMPKPKPMDVYTANSLDKEKMKRRADEMIANVRAKGLTLHDGTQP